MIFHFNFPMLNNWLEQNSLRVLKFHTIEKKIEYGSRSKPKNNIIEKYIFCPVKWQRIMHTCLFRGRGGLIIIAIKEVKIFDRSAIAILKMCRCACCVILSRSAKCHARVNCSVNESYFDFIYGNIHFESRYSICVILDIDGHWFHILLLITALKCI